MKRFLARPIESRIAESIGLSQQKISVGFLILWPDIAEAADHS